jgi:hypothetical protein
MTLRQLESVGAIGRASLVSIEAMDVGFECVRTDRGRGCLVRLKMRHTIPDQRRQQRQDVRGSLRHVRCHQAPSLMVQDEPI